MQRGTSAQLVTAFDPNRAPMAETTIDRALMQWSALDRDTQDAALLIVADDTGGRRVYARSAIADLLARS